MRQRKFFRRILTAFLIVVSLLTAAVVGAKIQMYTATGEGYANEEESQEIAKLRARDKAIKKATKEAGVYLKKYSRSVNSELTDDEITAITSNAWQLVGEPKYSRKVINHSGDTQIIVWTATVEVNVDDSEIQSWVKRDDKDKSTIISQTREAQKKSEENDRKIEDLREKYNRATSKSERDRIIKQMNEADRDFLANQKFEEGNKLRYKDDYYGAIKLYNEAIELKPDWSFPYNNRGLAYKNLGQKERAIQDFDKAIQLNPNNAEAYHNRGRVYHDLEQYELAIQDYSKSIQLHPNYFFSYVFRGNAYVRLKQYELAIQDYSKVIQLDPNDYGNYLTRAVYYERIKEYEKAIQDYDKAIQLMPDKYISYYSRAHCYGKLGEYEKAIADYNKTIQLNPNDSGVYHSRGITYSELKQYELAIQDYDKAIELDPNDENAYRNRGYAYVNLGQYENALKDFDKVLELNPNEFLAKIARERCLKAMGK